MTDWCAMPPMLPARSSQKPSLSDVLRGCIDSVGGNESVLGLPAADRAIVVLADGLGAANLKARAGHARYLFGRLTKRSTGYTVFPSTTAAAIASLTTGELPGIHGLVGYRVRDIDNDRVVNQLTGWDQHMIPERWQLCETLFHRAATSGISSVAIGPRRYSASGFSRAVLRGARYVSAESIAERFASVHTVFSHTDARIVYVYVPELDIAAHATGWDSDGWLRRLEELDAGVAALDARLGTHDGLIVTADHGIVDVPQRSHVIVGDSDGDPLLSGVNHIGGDPRCLQLYLGPSATEHERNLVRERWIAAHDDSAWIFTREDAIGVGLFGSVDNRVTDRIGDVLVAARKNVAFYDGRIVNDPSRGMIGHHGSLTREETAIPVLCFGAFSRV